MYAQEFFQSFLHDQEGIALLYGATIADVIIKGIGYSYWCHAGLKISSPDMPNRKRMRRAAFWGLVRLLIGFAFGSALAPLFFAFWRFSLLSYIILYVPARWFEWGIIQMMISPHFRSVNGLLSGDTRVWKTWRGKGIILSFVLDLALPIGGIIGIKAIGGCVTCFG